MKEPTVMEESTPPLFKTWNQIYAFVLLFHTALIALFYFITKHFE